MNSTFVPNVIVRKVKLNKAVLNYRTAILPFKA